MNWGQIKQAVRDYLEGDETTFTGHFDLFVRLAEEDIYRQVQLQFTKQLATTNILTGDRYLTIPTNCISIYSLSYSDPITGAYHMLLPKDLGFLKEAYPNPAEVEGAPRFYAYRDEQVLTVAPTPDDNYEMEMHYFRKPITIGNDDNSSNTNWLSENAENALIFGIILHGYTYLKGDQDVIDRYQKHFDKAIADLKTIAEGRQRRDSYRTVDDRIPV